MKPTEIKYVRRINMGNYEHEEATVTALLDEGEDYQTALQSLQEGTLAALSGKAPKPAAKVVKPAKEEPVKEEVKEEPAPKKVVKPKAPKKPVFIKYDREVPEHRDDLATVFNEIHPGWAKDPAVKKKCASISKEMVGEDFLEETGTILDSFKESVRSKLEEAEGDL